MERRASSPGHPPPTTSDLLAAAQDRSRSYLINEAITNYIEVHAYQDALVQFGYQFPLFAIRARLLRRDLKSNLPKIQVRLANSFPSAGSISREKNGLSQV
jgi:hypothetical protein